MASHFKCNLSSPACLGWVLVTCSQSLVPWVLPALPLNPTSQTTAALRPGRDLNVGTMRGGVTTNGIWGQGLAVAAVPTPGWHHCISHSGQVVWGLPLSTLSQILPSVSWYRRCNALRAAHLPRVGTAGPRERGNDWLDFPAPN